MKKPNHYFKAIHEAILCDYEDRIIKEPHKVEFLRMWTGETIIHIEGTTYWNHKENCFDVPSLMTAGITHFRILEE